MIALDTNVVVRFLVEDDVAQTDRAQRIIRSGPVFVSKTVLLEIEWVLRAAYRFDRRAIAAALLQFLGLPETEAQDAREIAPALAWYRDGLDFADALHLASSRSADRFVTFDRALHRQAKRLAGATPVVAA